MHTGITKSKRCSFLALIVLLTLKVCEGGNSRAIQVTNLRGKFLALEWVEQRCPSVRAQFVKDNQATFGLDGYVDLGAAEVKGPTSRAAKQLLEDTSMEDVQEDRTIPSDRHLMSASGEGLEINIDLTAWRSSACAIALQLVEKACAHASDDKGMDVVRPWMEALDCKEVATRS
mmetsp:Transcript_29909/g.41406  ORF Transcript_29909/g.41406 Transcript_29909/m.41406 type:complete len:174 (-) Transcript_29909:120-641(-)|eukprot:CAMPEP_0196579738 /NCGR_PEP_ID=MMETSP1081-20130531/24486_1 /TAXON_ID=36882 /ORGANISM="Pyramimonas amylifera, Strain CCMP720" /LENGTH=173 /DNA_ID=CAMNT_0041899405 /DNA_START=43 /DNA_END=564 /DNA_ORIENTATION=+